MNRYFEGLYFKHQKGDNVLAVIPGRSAENAFIQVITENESFHVDYPLTEYQKGEILRIGNSSFSERGIHLAIDDPKISLHGSLRYGEKMAIRGDIMGPFKFLPMECRHKVISMAHVVSGTVILGGKTLSFAGGKGYIEGDSGRSFPSRYAWIQCNDFAKDCSIMASVARIPFCGIQFWGCICTVMLAGQEYRLATYRGVRIRQRKPNILTLEQGVYKLEVTIDSKAGQKLAAPILGAMTRTIQESASCPAHFRFTKNGAVLFEEHSDRASYEYAFENLLS